MKSITIIVLFVNSILYFITFSKYHIYNITLSIEYIEWGISLMNIQPSDRILEIGIGPDVEIRKMSEFITYCIIYGISHSELMIKNALIRNK